MNSSDDTVSRTIAEWQKQVLQLDRRNHLLYFKARRSDIGIAGDGPNSFLRQLGSSRTGLSFTYAEPKGTTRSEDPEMASASGAASAAYVRIGQIETDCAPLDLQRRLRALRKRDREWREEQGVNVLFLAVGFLTWLDEEGGQARAPLLLVPCRLAQSSIRDPYMLLREPDDIARNVTLAYVVSQLGISLPEADGEEPPSQYLDQVEQLIRARQGWSADRSMALSTFQYSKMAMWQDLENLRRDGVEHPLVRALAGDTTTDSPGGDAGSGALKAGPSELYGGLLDDSLDVRNQLLILPADYSQILAVEAARSGEHLVIHGPPGTGKSQTIANIIATLLGEGRRVLFVSEKTAALDVVKRFLDRCGLGPFCLDLHSDRGRKSNVYQQLRESLEVDRRTSAGEFDYERLLRTRQHLNNVVRALHARRDPLGCSVFDMHGRLALLQEAPDVAFEVTDPLGLTEESFDEIRRLAARLSQRPLEFAAHVISRWRALRLGSPTLQLSDDIRSRTHSLNETADALMDQSASLCPWLGAPPCATRDDLASTGAVLKRLAEAPMVLEGWLEQGAASRLLDAAQTQADNQRVRFRLLEELSASLHEAHIPVSFRHLRERLAVAMVAEQDLTEVLGPYWHLRVVREAAALSDLAERLPTVVSATLGSGRAVAESLGLQMPSTTDEIRQLITWSRAITERAPIPVSWLDPQSLARLIEYVSLAERTLNSLKNEETRLFEDFREEFLDIADLPMLVRYRSDYGSVLRRLGGQYRKDQRLVRGLRKAADKPSLDEAISAIESALVVKRLRVDWEALHSGLAERLRSRFHGRETDWMALRSEVHALQNVLTQVPDCAGVRACLTDAQKAASVEQLTRTLMRDLEELSEIEIRFVGELAEGNPDAPIAHRAAAAQQILAPLEAVGDVVSALDPYLAAAPGSASDLQALVESGARLEKIEEQLKDSQGALSADFGSYYAEFSTNWEATIAALRWVADVLALIPVQAAGKWTRHLLEPAHPSEYTSRLAELQKAIAGFDSCTTAIDDLFSEEAHSWAEWGAADLSQVGDWAADLEMHAVEANAWIQYQDLVGELEARTVPSLVSRIREATDVAGMIPRVVERRMVTAWLDASYANEPVLRDFSARDQEGAIDEFRRLDERLPRSVQVEVRRRLLSRYPDRGSTMTGAGQLQLLQSQLTRRRGQLAVRRLFARIPHLLQTLKPCCLMSPLAVSQFLPRSSLETETLSFDAVIFDEASQIFPEDAVPSLVRAKQVIVVGDECQLPPTSFFRRAAEDADDDEDEDVAEETNAFEGRDSILEAMAGLLGTRVSERSLNVHYRSKHEDLIKFSNHHFYRDRLLLFPSPHLARDGLGLKDIFLEDGRYDAGASHTNRREAEEVVSRVFDLMRTCPASESIGVVALSRAQADRIEELINNGRVSAPDLEYRFDGDAREPFFVKNLENVQGDERDHILLSVGYGPTVGSDRVLNRFGPLNSEVGWRRLNVAISRARLSMTTIHSLRPSSITSQQAGARILRRYLEYIQNPRQAFESVITSDPGAETESPFEEEVRRALEEHGHSVRAQIGVAGYRIDLAIESDDGAGFDLGVECDGWMYHSSPAARDRDWQRQSVLEGLGWAIHRVWSTAWVRNRGAEIRAIEESLALARSGRSLSAGGGKAVAETVSDLSAETFEASLGNGPDVGLEAEAGSFNSTNPSVPEGSYLFDVYREASLVGMPYGPQLQYEPRRRIEPMLQRIAEIEGPVHFDTAMERIRVHYGMARARQASRDHVFGVLQSLEGHGLQLQRGKRRDDVFFWVAEPPGELSLSVPDVMETCRPRRAGSRSVGHIAPIEIENGTILVARMLIGASRDDLIRETARQFGYDRVGKEIQSSLSDAIVRLVGLGRLLESFGMLRPAA